MLRRLFVSAVPALTLLLAVGVLAPQEACADDFSDFLKEAKKKYQAYRAAVQDETIVEEMVTSSPTGEIKTLNSVFRKGDKMRLDSRMEMPGKPQSSDEPQVMMSTVVHDGTDYWMATPAQGKRKLYGRETQQYRAEQRLWDMIPDRARMIGSEKLGEIDCYVLELVAGEDEPGFKLWMDKKRWVIVVVESGGVSGQEDRMVYSDFRKVEGDWEIPYKTEISRGDRLLSTLVVKSRQANTNLADTIFDSATMGDGTSRPVDVRDLISNQGEGAD